VPDTGWCVSLPDVRVAASVGPVEFRSGRPVVLPRLRAALDTRSGAGRSGVLVTARGSRSLAGRCPVYVCHPMTSYGQPGTTKAIATLARLLPGAVLVNPEDRGWKDSSEWLEEWPGLLVALAGLVVIGDRLDTIGTGCLREVTDAITLGLPLAALAPGGRVLRELRGVELVEPDSRCAGRAGFPLYGAVLRDFPGAVARQ